MASFNVELKKVVDDSYEIEIGYGLEQKLVDDIKAGLVGKISKFVVVTDSNVKELYADKIYNLLQADNYKTDLVCFPAGETSKTRKTKEYVEDSMLQKGYRRDCCIIAVGGGVVTDLAGFVAGTYGRGIPFINYATTLLAAADASVGGKTAVDTELATNLIGLFNQPEKVYIDIASWKTLPERQLSSGLAETIKHACMADKEMFEFLENGSADDGGDDKHDDHGVCHLLKEALPQRRLLGFLKLVRACLGKARRRLVVAQAEVLIDTLVAEYLRRGGQVFLLHIESPPGIRATQQIDARS